MHKLILCKSYALSISFESLYCFLLCKHGVKISKQPSYMESWQSWLDPLTSAFCSLIPLSLSPKWYTSSAFQANRRRIKSVISYQSTWRVHIVMICTTWKSRLIFMQSPQKHSTLQPAFLFLLPVVQICAYVAIGIHVMLESWPVPPLGSKP